MESMFNEPPSPYEALGAAWAKVTNEKVVGSATACIVSLDQRLNQLTYANLGDSGVIILRHMSPQVYIYILTDTYTYLYTYRYIHIYTSSTLQLYCLYILAVPYCLYI